MESDDFGDEASVSDAVATADLLELKEELLKYRLLVPALKRRFFDGVLSTFMVNFGLCVGFLIFIIPLFLAFDLNWRWLLPPLIYAIVFTLLVVLPLFLGVMLRMPKELEEA